MVLCSECRSPMQGRPMRIAVCMHVYCCECFAQLIGNGAVCSCGTLLTDEENVRLVEPGELSEAQMTLILAGYPPEVIAEAAKRALAFWSHAQKEEREWLDSKSRAEALQSSKQAIRQRDERIRGLEERLEAEKQRAQGLQRRLDEAELGRAASDPAPATQPPPRGAAEPPVAVGPLQPGVQPPADSASGGGGGSKLTGHGSTSAASTASPELPDDWGSGRTATSAAGPPSPHYRLPAGHDDLPPDAASPEQGGGSTSAASHRAAASTADAGTPRSDAGLHFPALSMPRSPSQRRGPQEPLQLPGIPQSEAGQSEAAGTSQRKPRRPPPRSAAAPAASAGGPAPRPRQGPARHFPVERSGVLADAAPASPSLSPVRPAGRPRPTLRARSPPGGSFDPVRGIAPEPAPSLLPKPTKLPKGATLAWTFFKKDKWVEHHRAHPGAKASEIQKMLRDAWALLFVRDAEPASVHEREHYLWLQEKSVCEVLGKPIPIDPAERRQRERRAVAAPAAQQAETRKRKRDPSPSLSPDTRELLYGEAPPTPPAVRELRRILWSAPQDSAGARLRRAPEGPRRTTQPKTQQ
eukprot:TRINITY_DN39869_c0_g1_i1.p1 TRINITY_DN39869_c0_g1~~TRINITY_DN39869_c0_g1_i1.p1  ORF type:complete len:605 (+),score=117.72 TRINITY_DN39869_c0_g1_i1:75-1817(+)